MSLLRSELRWWAGELGAVRDAEVMRDRVRSAVAAECVVDDLGPVSAVVDAELGQAYRVARDRVLGELDGDRYHALLVALEQLAEAAPVTPKASARAGRTLPRLVGRG